LKTHSWFSLSNTKFLLVKTVGNQSISAELVV
jgi:hypothetical protein